MHCLKEMGELSQQSRDTTGQCSSALEKICWAGNHTSRQKIWRGKRKTCQAAMCYRKPRAQPQTSSASSLGTLSTEMTWTYWSISRRSHKNTPRAGAPLFWRKKVGGEHPGEEKAPEELWFSSNISKNLKTNHSYRKEPSPKAFSTLWKDIVGLEVGGDNGSMTAQADLAK